MQTLQFLLSQHAPKRIREQYKLYSAYKHLVKESILNHTTNIHYENKCLVLEMTDQVWANQVMYYREIIKERLRKTIPGIKTVKVCITKDPPKKRRKPQETTHHCQQCGSSLITAQAKRCSVCISQNEAIISAEIQRILKQTPWIRYQECDESLKQRVKEPRFNQEKQFKIRRIYDTINQGYFDVQKESIQALEYYKANVEEYIILKCGITPEKLNKDIIKKHLSARLYKAYIKH